MPAWAWRDVCSLFFVAFVHHICVHDALTIKSVIFVYHLSLMFCRTVMFAV